MGAISDVWTKLGGNDKVAEAIETAESIISIIPKISSAYNAVMTVFQALGVFAKEDLLKNQIQEIEKIIGTGFTLVLEKQQAEGIIERWRDIVIQQEIALTQVQIIRDNKPGDSTFDESELNRDSLLAVNTLENNAFWNRPFYDADIYEDNWTGLLKPPIDDIAGSQLVWDYRLILPAYLQAISCRLMVISVLSSNHKIDFKKELSNYSKVLINCHETIRNSIVSMRIPRACELLGLWYWDVWYTQINEGWEKHEIYTYTRDYSWNKNERIYGAIELYTGLKSSNQYIDSRFDFFPNCNLYISSDNYPMFKHLPEIAHFEQHSIVENLRQNEEIIEYKICLNKDFYIKFITKLAIRTFKCKRDLYTHIGLPAIWRIINKLCSIVEEPQLDKTINYSILSLRMIANEINDVAMRMGCESLSKPIGMRDIALKLEKNDPISLREILDC